MGWAWRSSESYGDKDDAQKPESTAESRGAQEPTADAASDKRVFGFSNGERRSLWEDDYEDWRGYRGHVYEGYSYDKAIDDSDDRWYRKSSFRYGGYSDYSPSSLFRSAFYSPRFSAYGEENDLKNKAIRALRTLTRNANTVCDKDARISYAVQYSNGANANSAEETLIDGKKNRVIYVSPDAVVNAKTTEEEDAAIDALTGFVLLRVQIAQEFQEKTIDKINALTLRALPKKLAAVFKHGESFDSAKISAEHVDGCLAGMLSKSLLTRLARRHIVKDWGGFGPYLVRHAKKFAAVREQLEKVDESVESVVGKIAYNMVDDENQFTLEAGVEAIVTKHLGAELPAEAILDACHALIAELRAYLSAKLTQPAGDVEQQLNELINNLVKEHAERLAEQQKNEEAATSALQEFAKAINDYTSATDQANTAHDKLLNQESELNEEVNQLFTKDQFIQKLKADAAALKELLENLETARATGDKAGATVCEQSLKYYQETIAARVQHFAQQFEELKDSGVTSEIKLENYRATDPTELAEKVREEIKDMTNVYDEATKLLKDKVAEIRDKALKYINDFVADRQQQQDDAKAYVEKLSEHEKKIRDVAKDATIESVSAYIPAAVKSMREYVQVHATAGKAPEFTPDSIKSCRSVNTLRTEFNKFVRARKAKSSSVHYDLGSPHGWASAGGHHAVTQFMRDAVAAVKAVKQNRAARGIPVADGLKNLEWEIDAIATFLRHLNSEDSNFEAAAISAANEELLKQLNKIFKSADDSVHVPSHVGHIEDAEQQKMLKRLAESMGLRSQQLLDVHAALAGMENSPLNQAGKAVGKQIRELLPLFEQISSADEQLFGSPISVKTTALTDAINQVNDEARNDPEEEYVAYLSHNQAKPTVRIQSLKPNAYARERAKEIAQRQRGAISRIREALQFQNGKRTGEIFGVRSGDLDEGGLHKLGYDCEHIWAQKTIAKLPDVAVGILVDQSGSMSCRNKIVQAREMCVALAEAVKKIPGVHLHIYGHSANMHDMSDLTLFEHYSSQSDTAAQTADLATLGGIDAFSNNYDGYAIKETAKLLAKDPAKRKYLFVIADGLPHGEGYAGPEAQKHVTSVCQFVRERLKIATYAFAVGVHGSARDEFIEQYGQNHVMFLTEVHSCLPQIVRFLRNSLQREKTLVEVTA